MKLTESARKAITAQPAGIVCRAGCSLSFESRYVDFILRAFCCLLLFGFLGGSQLLAQCAVCRAGGHCANSQDGKCLANRTFWGYYQSNWRKWPSVAAAEQAAAFEAEHTQLPSADAPSVVLPKPEDEAREGNLTPGAREGTSTEQDAGEEGDSPNDNIAPPRRTKAQNSPDAEQSPLNQTKQLLPEPSTVRPKRPGAELDDPAPVLPVDPNDSVPNLPPNLKNMKPPADENLNLENLFKAPDTPEPKSPATSAPQPSGEAAKQRSNAPAEANMTPAERTAEFIRRRREHAERNRQYLQEKYAKAKTPLPRDARGSESTKENVESPTAPASDSPAVANGSSSAATLDELTTLNRLEGPEAGMMSRKLSDEIEAAEADPAVASQEEQAADKVQVQPASAAEEPPTLEGGEPELLLKPTDSTSQNPLRENVEHARYAARMFTPQVRAESSNVTSQATGLGGVVNPLRSGGMAAASQRNVQREIVPVTYEEQIPTQASESDAVAPQPLTRSEEAEINLSPPPASDVLPTAAAAVGSSTQSPREAVEQESSAPVTIERQLPQDKEAAANSLRDEPAHGIHRSTANPLRESDGGNASGKMEGRGAALPVRAPAAGRYTSTVGISASPAVSSDSPVTTERAGEPLTLGTANPLRKCL